MWQKSQSDVAELNNALPEGIRVVKSLFGNEYRVVNKIDGYEFRVPQKWEGLREIEYSETREVESYIVSGMWFEGKSDEESRIASINRYELQDANINLQSWAERNFETSELVGEFSKDQIGELEIVKTREEIHFAGMAVVFFQKDLSVYVIVNGSEENIREIVENGKW